MSHAHHKSMPFFRPITMSSFYLASYSLFTMASCSALVPILLQQLIVSYHRIVHINTIITSHIICPFLFPCSILASNLELNCCRNTTACLFKTLKFQLNILSHYLEISKISIKFIKFANIFLNIFIEF